VYEGPFDVPTTYLQPGDNLLAVEVHQVSTGSTDVVFGMTLDTVRTVTNMTSGPTDARINEIAAAARRRPRLPPAPDWVELFNEGRATWTLRATR